MGTLDAKNEAASLYYNESPEWQSFKAGATGYIDQISLSGYPTSAGLTISISVYAGEGIAGALIGSVSLTMPEGAEEGEDWQTWVFPAYMIAVTTEETYTIYAATAGFAWAQNLGEYADGTSSQAPRDFLFRTYVVALTEPEMPNLQTVFECWVQWNGTDWSDQSAYFISAKLQADIADPSKGIAATGAGLYQTATVQVANDAGRYSPDNTGGPYYASISGCKGLGIPIKITGYYTAGGDELEFVGYIDNIELSSPTDPVATFYCVGGEYPLLEHKTTRTADASEMQKDVFISDWLEILATEANITDTAIDAGMFRVGYAWFSDGDSIWGEMQSAAAAEGGYLYVSTDGQLRFENLYHWLTDTTHATSQGTLNENDYTGISRTYSQGETFNAVACPYKPRGAGARARLFSLTEYWNVIAGGEKTFYVELKQPALNIEQPTANKEYVVVTGGDVDVSSKITITLTKRPQQVAVKVVNGSSQNATFRKFELWGTPLVGGKTSQIIIPVTTAAIGDGSDSGELLKLKTMGQNDMVQSITQAELLATVEADRVGIVSGAVTISGVPARPGWELGDRITVASTTFDTYSRDCYIVGLSTSMGPGPVFEQEIKVIECAAMYPYAAADYFILGTDEPGNTKRLFY